MARGWQARMAACVRPYFGSNGWPTAYTPRKTRCSRPTRTWYAIALALKPIPLSCAYETTPCCRAASAATCQARVAFGRCISTSRRNASGFRPPPARAGGLIPCALLKKLRALLDVGGVARVRLLDALRVLLELRRG